MTELDVEQQRPYTAPDVYFTDGYLDASTVLEGLDGWAEPFESRQGEGTVRIPLIVRPLPDDNGCDATGPYGYGGPWVDGVVDPDKLADDFRTWTAERGIIATFLRLHPLFDQERIVGGIGEPIAAGCTIAWPLTPGVDLLAGMKKKHRQYVRKSERDGLRLRVRENPGDLSSFTRLYERSMERLDASAFYSFEEEYWDRLLAADDVDLLLVEAVDGDSVETSLLCLVGPRFVHAHLLGSTDRGRLLKGNYLCYYGAAAWGQQHGREVFHLGGGFGGEASELFQWKHGFCPAEQTARFMVMKLVHDVDKYAARCGTAQTEGFFPPWRAPTPRGERFP